MGEDEKAVISINGKQLESVSQFNFQDDQRQLAILGHLLHDRDFFLVCHRRIRPDWFTNSRHSRIYGWFLQLHTEMGEFPNIEELKHCSGMVREEQDERLRLEKEMIKAKNHAGQIRKEALKEDLTAWMHSKILQDAMVKASKSWNQKKWGETAYCLEEAAREFRETTFEPANEISFRDSQKWLEEAQNNQREALTTGCYLLDKALLNRKENDDPDDPALSLPKSRGLQLGDTTVVLAPSNTGKTTSLLTIARHNIADGKNVLLMTHEGRPEDIRTKMFCAALQCSKDEIFALYKDPVRAAQIAGVEELIARHLKYIPYNKAGMLVEDVLPIIRHEQDKKAAGTGKGFDLLVVDYPALLSTERAKHGHMSPRHIQDLVYQFYVQLALEYNFHSLVAIQTNREGSRINSGNHQGKASYQSEAKDHRLLGMEDVMEAWGPMTSASNVITLNRSPADKVNKRMTYYVAKSRSSETGVAVVVKTNFAASLTHFRGRGFSSTSYQGNYTMEGAIDGHLLNSNGKHLDQHMVYEDSKS